MPLIFFSPVLGTALGVLHMFSQHPTTKLHPSSELGWVSW